ncbi:MAG: response regulator transcription factor [Verrucomicrobiota bacterium]
MHKILVVDDEKDVSDLITFNLNREGIECVVAATGTDAVHLAKRETPDIIVLDIMLPGLDGFEVFKELRLDSRTKDIPVLMLSAKGQLDDIINGLELGADDYLTKPFSPKELVLRIQNLLRRINTSIGSTEVRVGKFHLDKNSLHFFLDGDQVELTPTEFKLLLLLVERSGQPQKREDLLREVWGYRDAAQTRTLDTHVKRLREKMGNFANWIETVRGIGYRFEDREPSLVEA